MNTSDATVANTAVQRLLGQRCWAVVYGPETWTNMSLKLGAMVPRVRPIRHPTDPPSVRQFDGQFRVFVQGPWSIGVIDAGVQRMVEHSRDTLELARSLFTDATLVGARIVPGEGARFAFSSGASLLVRQERLLGDDPVEPVVTVFLEDGYFTLMSNGLVQWNT